LRAYPELPEDANVGAWLVTIAHRKAIDQVRRRQRQAVPVAEVPEQRSSMGVPGAAGRDVWDAVRSLPEKQRQTVAYHYLGGLPYAEIAEIIGGSTESARRAAADGIRALRRKELPDE
jgi:RNA polymerase sigma factor (sigma-70 family)